jgi:hypothetical protein
VLIDNVDDAVAGFGLKDAVAPEGSPAVLSVTAAVNPPLGVIETAYVVPLPTSRVRLVGDTDKLKSAEDGLCTTRAAFVVCVRLPLVPVIVSVDVPAGVVVLVVTVIVDDVPVGFGLNDAAAPDGRPLALSETEPAKPPLGVIDTLYVVLPPATTVLLAGVAPSEKSGDPVPAFRARKTLILP